MGQTQEWHKVHFWFQRARHKNGPGFILVPKSQTQEWLCFQWARHTNDPSSFWFQRARHKNGFVSNGPDTRMTQVHFVSKEPDTGMAHLHIYIYIYKYKYIYIYLPPSCARRRPWTAKSRYVFSTRHQALRWPLPGDG